MTSINVLNLTPKTHNGLLREGCRDVSAVVDLSRGQLLTIMRQDEDAVDEILREVAIYRANFATQPEGERS